MNRKIKTIIGGGVLASAMAIGSVAGAAVTFDPATGTGFVGKGDVQQPLGLNNQQMNSQAALISFSYSEVGTYTMVCGRQHHQHGYEEKTFRNKEVGIQASVTSEQRKNSQGNLTGFTLTGLGEEASSGEGCPSGHPIEVSRTPNDDAGEVVGLVAHHGETAIVLPWPAAE